MALLELRWVVVQIKSDESCRLLLELGDCGAVVAE